CPALQPRILNGQKVTDDCPYSGISNITFEKGTISCGNAVFTIATVNGNTKPTFLTTGALKDIIEGGRDANIVFEIQIGNQKYPILPGLFTLYNGPDGTAFIDLDPAYSRLLDSLGGCQKEACAYNNATMYGLIDFNTCKILSYGTSDAELTSQDGLYEANVIPNEGGCTNIPDESGSANSKCYKAVSGRNLMCTADLGAPVYCYALKSKEWILQGVAAFQSGCDESSEFRVLPYPG
ncbi:unnamed protein product, partial [Candidula unifasciata]